MEEKEWRKKIWINNRKPIKRPMHTWTRKIRLIITFIEHIRNSTIEEPIKGIIERILINTVIPQYDIWPQQRIYPKNPSINKKIKINQPEIQIKFTL